MEALVVLSLVLLLVTLVGHGIWELAAWMFRGFEPRRRVVQQIPSGPIAVAVGAGVWARAAAGDASSHSTTSRVKMELLRLSILHLQGVWNELSCYGVRFPKKCRD